jgi:hypothetical protein
MTVSDLLEQPYNKSDTSNINKLLQVKNDKVKATFTLVHIRTFSGTLFSEELLQRRDIEVVSLSF